VKALELVAFLWATAWAWRAGLRLLYGDRNSLMIVYLVFYAEYALPLGLDALVGRPTYSQQPGFASSSQDPWVRALYCLFLFLVPLMWLWKAKMYSRTARAQSPRWVIMMLRLGSLLPVYFALVAPEPRLYLQYAGVMRANASLDVLIFHIVVSMATMVAVLCVAVRCLIESPSRKTTVEIAVAIVLSIWINGKRYIVAEACMFLILALWYRGAITGKKLAWTTATCIVLFCAFSLSYQSNVRGISIDPMAGGAAGEDVRVDYTRDSRVQMALYSTLHPDRIRILDYAGQNLSYYITLLVPRTVWTNKPYPYAYYFTSAMLNRYPQDFGWGMTTGVFDETIANAGLIGILIGPLLVRWFCALGDSINGWCVHILTCVIGCLLLSVQLAAFTPLVLIWVVIVGKSKHIPIWRPATSRTPRSEAVV
jgi:hypothetical protein